MSNRKRPKPDALSALKKNPTAGGNGGQSLVKMSASSSLVKKLTSKIAESADKKTQEEQISAQLRELYGEKEIQDLFLLNCDGEIAKLEERKQKVIQTHQALVYQIASLESQLAKLTEWQQKFEAIAAALEEDDTPTERDIPAD